MQGDMSNNNGKRPIIDYKRLTDFRLEIMDWLHSLFVNTTASVTNTTGTPAVAVSINSNGGLDLAFTNIKGADGSMWHGVNTDLAPFNTASNLTAVSSFGSGWKQGDFMLNTYYGYVYECSLVYAAGSLSNWTYKGCIKEVGPDGYSPAANVSKSGNTATITITDKNGTTTAQVTDGQDGYSPVASVSKSGNTATITITDKSGTTTAQVTDGQDGANTKSAHYLPTDVDAQILLMEEGTDTTTVSGESIKYVNIARELNIDAKKHIISADYERYDYPAEPKVSPNRFIVNWLVINIEERLVPSGTTYAGKIAIPLFCPRSALKGYMTQRYWLLGKNNFRQCDMFIQNYILDSETLIKKVNVDTFWSSFGISGFMGSNNAYQYLTDRFGIGGNISHKDYSVCPQFRNISIDMRNHWTVFDSDFYWKRDTPNRRVDIHHSALYHCGGALDYNNDIVIESKDYVNTLQLSFLNERVREDFLGGRKYQGFYQGDELFYDFGFMMFQTGIVPNTSNFDGGWDGSSFTNYTSDQGWAKIFDALKDESQQSAVLAEIADSPYFDE